MTMIFHSGVPHSLWVEAFTTATFLINRLPSSSLNFTSAYFLLYGNQPNYSTLRVFGTRCYPYTWDTKRNKFDPKSISCVFVGYSDKHKGYRCFDPKTQRMLVTRHVVFDEYMFPYKTKDISSHFNVHLTSFLENPPSFSKLPSPMIDIPMPSQITSPPPCALENNPIVLFPTPPTDQDSFPTSNTDCRAVSLHDNAMAFDDSTINGNCSSTDQNQLHSMVTRAKHGIYKPNPRYALVLISDDILREPQFVKMGLKHAGWRNAMLDELAALRQNQTWTLVPRAPHMNVVGSKWVFKTKLKADGSLDRLKARLVAKGHHQIDGIDYIETFSPVIKPGTIRLVLSLAMVRQWDIRQLDVKNAFLYGHISEDIYMTQPPGMHDPNSFVCL